MKTNAIVAAILVVGIVFAGCAGSEAGQGKALASTTAPPPVVSKDTGSIAGLVVDQEARPLANADVAIVGAADLNAKTDTEGRFTFNELTPGTYTVTALKLGYESLAKKVDVVAGQTLDVSLTLTAMVVDDEPRIDYKVTDGYIAGPNVYSAAVIYYSTPNFVLNLTRGARDITASMEWQQNTPTTAKYMRVGVTHDGDTKWAIGPSPLTANLTEADVEKEKDKATISYSLYFMCGVTPQCFIDHPDALVPVVVYQQRVKIYTSVFYNQDAPEGYTGLPE